MLILFNFKNKLIGIKFQTNTNQQLGWKFKKSLCWIKTNSRKSNQITLKKFDLVFHLKNDRFAFYDI